jgi:serine/threonine-protein kinase
MSPEQASGRAVDQRTDQFSVGLILYEMATGRPVFRRDTPAQVLAAVIERDPEPLRRLRGEGGPAQLYGYRAALLVAGREGIPALGDDPAAATARLLEELA